MSPFNPFPGRGQEGEEWISISDLMSGLMIVFLAIAVFFMRRVIEPVEVYQATRDSLYVALYQEFEDSLPSWNAEIVDSTLSVVFPNPDVLFSTGSDTVQARFRRILDDFFPRYVAVLMREDFRAHIQEVRIEGHTSSFWEGEDDLRLKYLHNMRLSQDRSRAVLAYVSELDRVQTEAVWDDWLKVLLTANGLSSSQLIRGSDGTENPARSQRVEFLVRTDADKRIAEMLRQTSGQEP